MMSNTIATANEDESTSTNALLAENEAGMVISNQQVIRKYWVEKKRKYREMMKNKTIKRMADNESNEVIECSMDGDYQAEGLIRESVEKIVEYFHTIAKPFSHEMRKIILNRVLLDPHMKDLHHINPNEFETSLIIKNLRRTLQNMSRSEDDLMLKRSSLMMILNSEMLASDQQFNISSLSRTMGVSRKTVYDTISRLSSIDGGSSILRMTTRCKPTTTITAEIKETIGIFWKSESRVSPNKKDICRKRLGRNQYEEHSVHLLDISQVLSFSANTI